MTDPVVGKFGKLPAVHDQRVKMLADITQQYKIAAPKYWRVDWSRKLDVSKLGTLLNTVLGDCSIASKFHDIQLWTAWTGTQAVFTDALAQQLYEQWCGYIPGKNDPGGALTSVLNHWLNSPIAGHVLSGYAAIEPGNLDDLRNGIWLCGNVDVGLVLPKTCIPQGIWRLVSTSGDGARGSAGGHDVNCIAYNDQTQLITFITWGHLKQMSYSFFHYYNDEGYALASKDWLLATQETPSDYKWDDLIATMNSEFSK